MLVRRLDALSRGLLYEAMGGIEEFRRVLRIVLQDALNDMLSVEHVDEFSCIGRRDVPQFNERWAAWLLSHLDIAKILGIEIAVSKKGDNFHRYPLLDLLEYGGYIINRARLEKAADTLWSKAKGVTKFDVIGCDRHSKELYFVEVKNPGEMGISSVDAVDESVLKRAIEGSDTLKTQFLRQQEFINNIRMDVTARLLYAIIDVGEENTKVALYQASERDIEFNLIKRITAENEKLRVEKYEDLDTFFFAVKDGIIPLCQAMRSIIYLIRMKLLQKEILEERLEKIDRNDLASWFERMFGYPLTGDNRRHDIEDQLERRGFVERATDRKAIYYITPAGWVRATYFETLITQQKISISELAKDVENEVMLLSKTIIKEVF